MSEQARGLKAWLEKKGVGKRPLRVCLVPVGERVVPEWVEASMRCWGQTREVPIEIAIAGNGFTGERNRVALPSTADSLAQIAALVLIVAPHSSDVLHAYRMLKEFARVSRRPAYAWVICGSTKALDAECLKGQLEGLAEESLGIRWPLLGSVAEETRNGERQNLPEWPQFVRTLIDAKGVSVHAVI